jgi:hypothetical protein
LPTAEEAAAANLAWRAVNAPSTVTSAEQAQAQQYSNQYYNVERPAQQARDAAIQQTIYQNRQMINAQEVLSYAGTHTQAQLAALSGSAAVGRQAYAEEQSYYASNPSSEFQNITNQYAASRTQITTGNRTYAATGELELNTTAGEGGYTGRAAEYKSAFDRQVYGIGAPDNEQEYYRRAAERAVVERAGYTAPSDLGDVRTQQIRQGYGMFSKAVGLAGGEVASDYQMTGRIIETQRQAAYATPTRRDERFFMGELQKWGEIPVEKASAYHDIGMESGKAIPANPYEYQADLAVEFLKGSPDKASEFFSPVSGEMSRYLPGGQGVQEFAWNEAITDYKRQTGAANTPYPEQVSFMQGVTYLGAAEGKYGPYGKLAGGVDNGGVDLAGGRTRGGNVVGGSAIFGGATSLPKPFVSVSAPVTSPDLMTQAGLWLAGAERTTVEYTGIGRLPTPTTEQIKEMGKNPLFMSTNPIAAGLLNIPQTQEYAASFIRGEAVQIQTKPLESAVNYGLAYVGGVAFKGLEYGAAVSRASFAEKAIAGGGGWRAAEMFAANAPRVGGAVLTGAYAVSVGARATDWGRDFSPAAAERLGGIAIGEAIPGGLGFVHGYRTPSTVYKAAQISDIGYKASLQEGLTTGRSDYYVRQPLSKPYNLAKQEYSAFVQERPDLPKTTTLYRGEAGGVIPKTSAPGGTTGRWYTESSAYAEMYGSKIYSVKVPTAKLGEYYSGTKTIGKMQATEYVLPQQLANARIRYRGDTEIVQSVIGKVKSPATSYVQYKGERVVRSATIPVKAFIQETPLRLQRAGTSVLEPFVRARVEAVPRAQAALGRASIEFASWRYAKNQPIAEAAYGRYFTAKTKLPVAAESAYLSTYRSAWEIAQAAKTPGITIKTAWQEYGGIDTSNIIRPTAEIIRINKMSSFRYPEVTPASRSITKPMGKISIPFESRKLTGEQTPIKPTSPEIRTKGGSLLSRMEEPVIRSQESFSVVEPRTVGLPVWPSGPSPIQKQKFRIEEEEQYYRLPHGMVSPGPKRETVQSIMALPMSGLVTGQKMAFETMSSQFQRFDQTQSVKQTLRERQRFEQVSKVSPELTFTQKTREFTAQFSEQVPISEITTVPYQGITTVPKQGITTIPRLGTPDIPYTSTIPRPRTPPETPFIPFGGFLPGGGGGYGYKGNLGVTTWRRNNLVADMPYLAKGMRSISWGMDIGSGGYSEKTTWFKTGKKRKVSRRKKK